jgi:hypothetical protein
MSVATSRLEIDTHLGFGRGSAVREYWLMRCQGFYVVRADGRRLGQVKRVETHMEGTFLRVRGLRARTVHFSAVDTVWPGASLLVISDEHVHDGSEDKVGPLRADRRPAWIDDTVPWWELVDGANPGATEHVNAAPPRIPPHSAQFTLHPARMQTLALSFKRVEPFAKAFAARTTNLVDGARNLARTFAGKAIRATRATLQALDSGRRTARSAVLATTGRMRLRVARSLVRIAVCVGGSNAFAVDDCHDSQLRVDELVTEEIDPDSGSA